MKGSIVRYLTEKRYGFISPEGDSGQVFFHQSVFDCREGPPPITGEPVEYMVGEDARATSVVRQIQPKHHVGVVKSYDSVKGYGFITTPTGQFYLHKSEVLGGAVPAVGSKVDFYTPGEITSGKSSRACFVGVLQ